MQNLKIPLTIKESLRTNFVIWLFLLIGQSVFFLVCLVLTLKFKKNVDTYLQNVLLGIGIFLPMILIFISLKIFNQRMLQVDKSTTLLEKLSEFRTASIIRWALIEVCLFFNLAFVLADGNKYHLLLALLFLVFFVSTFPSKGRISTALELSQTEIDLLNYK